MLIPLEKHDSTIIFYTLLLPLINLISCTLLNCCMTLRPTPGLASLLYTHFPIHRILLPLIIAFNPYRIHRCFSPTTVNRSIQLNLRLLLNGPQYAITAFHIT